MMETLIRREFTRFRLQLKYFLIENDVISAQNEKNMLYLKRIFWNFNAWQCMKVSINIQF